MTNRFFFKGFFSGLIIVFFVVLSIQKSMSQEFKPYSPAAPKAFIGLGAGVNDYGLGLGVEINMTQKFWLYGMAGISTWGYRFTGGMTYYPGKDGFKSSFSLGYSHATGSDDFAAELDVEGKYSEPEEREVVLEFYPINTVNLTYSYNLKVGAKSKFVFSAGYAISLTEKKYEHKNLYGSEDLTQGSKDFIDFMAPGGVIVGVKFMFGDL